MSSWSGTLAAWRPGGGRRKDAQFPWFVKRAIGTFSRPLLEHVADADENLLRDIVLANGQAGRGGEEQARLPGVEVAVSDVERSARSELEAHPRRQRPGKMVGRRIDRTVPVLLGEGNGRLRNESVAGRIDPDGRIAVQVGEIGDVGGAVRGLD